tara:strand:- start:383 stop:862 length:480 start_codon:yes stop_codon:yes gene_type:complete
MNYEKIYWNILDGFIDEVENKVIVYESSENLIFGKRFVFRIIGGSHFISSKDCNYGELYSCVPFDDENMELLNLNILNVKKIIEKKIVKFENEFLSCENNISVLKLSECDVRKDFDLFYEFDEGAFTGININDEGYKTVHTYPEYDRIVFTGSNFVMKK